MGEDLKLVSPVERFLNETQLELLKKRSDAEWMADHAEDYAARMIYGMQPSFKNKSWQEEDRGLSDVRVTRNVELIKRDPAFRRMVEKEGPLGLADQIIRDKGGLTDAYSKAANEVEKTGELKHPERRTNEQRIDYWRQRKGAVAEDAPAAPEADKAPEQILAP